jgi:site-specific recombinase XerD
MSEPGLVDITGRLRSPAATPGHWAGCAPPNKGQRYLVRAGKGGKRRMVGMDDWGWEHVGRWTEHRIQLPVGPLFCILAGPTRGRGWSATAGRGELRRRAALAGVRRRFAPHQLRHAHAIEMNGTQP